MSPEVPESQVIQNIVEAIWGSGEPNIDLSLWCAKELAKYFPHWGDLEICDVSEDVERKVKSRLKEEISRCKEKRITPRYEFSEVSNVLYRARDVRIDEIKSKVKAVDWRNFEYLCMHLLEINGIEEAEVTRGTKEGGIDFYGLLRMHKFSQGLLLNGLEIRIIGQARHHSTDEKVGEPEVKLFAKQYSDFKSEQGRGQEAVPEWFRNLKSPLTALFITNTEFTKDAYNAAIEEGIIPKDGDQIAEDLFHSPRVNEWLTT